jgi:hypothetical protein
MVHYLTNDGNFIFLFDESLTILQVLHEFRQAIAAEPELQLAYLQLHPELSEDFFEDKCVLDVMHALSELAAFEHLNDRLERDSPQAYLWRDDLYEWGQANLFLWTIVKYCIWASPPST